MADKKTVLITGASRGIGLSFVAHYKQNGWNVIATARNLETADKLKALEPHKLLSLDTSSEESILAAAKQLEGESIDLLINNAGIGWPDTIETTTKEALMQTFEVNAVGPFLVTRALVPNLRAAVAKHGSATVAQLSTIMASITDNVMGSTTKNGSGGLYAYRASKTALNMINASLTHDLKNDKITTILLHPGYVSTDMTYNTGEVTPDASVAGLTKIIANLTEADSGKFIQYDGVPLTW